MTKKLLGALAVGALGLVAVATRDQWLPLLREGVARTFVWAIDDPMADLDDDEEDKERG